MLDFAAGSIALRHIVLRTHSEMSGTNLQHVPTRLRRLCYRCFKVRWRPAIMLRLRYAMSGTDILSRIPGSSHVVANDIDPWSAVACEINGIHTSLRVCSALSGTDTPYSS